MRKTKKALALVLATAITATLLQAQGQKQYLQKEKMEREPRLLHY